MLRKLKNYVSYGVWTDCTHEWEPAGFYGKRCKLGCGVDEKDNGSS